ncbi:MAG: helix-turn-helix domain-containing protein [Clostridiales bacterium]|nr:helix-turn-helix domain-containing protein [Clostridiales bacterium]
MPERKAEHSNKTFIGLLLSYMFILAATLITGSIVYINASLIIREQEHHAESIRIKQIASNIDARFSELYTMAKSAAMNQDIQNFLAVRANMTESQRFMAFNVIKALRSHRNGNNFIEDMFVYFVNSDVVINTNSMTQPSQFYNYIFSYAGMDYETWRGEALINQSGSYLPLQDVRITGRSERLMTLMQRIPITESYSPSAVIFMLISEEKLRGMVEGVPEDGAIFIVDEKEGLVFSFGNFMLMESVLSQVEQSSSSVISLSGSSGRFLVSSADSAHNSWRYISAIPESTFVKDAYAIQFTAIGVLVASLMIGVLMAVFFARRSYSPIQQILELLRNQKRDSRPKPELPYGNELDFIKHSIADVYEENDMLASTFEDMSKKNSELMESFARNMNSLKNSFISDLLRGRVKSQDSFESLCLFHQISFTSEIFISLLFSEDQKSGDFSRNDGSLRFFIISFLEERLCPLATANAAEMDEGVIGVLINRTKDPYPEGRSMISDLQDVASKVQQAISNFRKISMTVGIGGIHDGLAGIEASCKEAFIALDYRIVRGRGQVIAFDEIAGIKSKEDASARNILVPAGVEMKLLNYVKSGDIEKCRQLLTSILEEHKSWRNDIKYAKCLFFNQICIALKILDESGIRYSDMPEMDKDPLDILLESESVEEIFDAIMFLFSATCRHFRKSQENCLQSHKNQIINYIEENFCNSELCQTAIAEHFSITPQYLSKLFRQALGKNMVDYINWRRVEKVKELLAEPMRPISEISEMVGFGTVRNMDRVFKRYEGVTPGMFRSLVASKEEK